MRVLKNYKCLSHNICYGYIFFFKKRKTRKEKLLERACVQRSSSSCWSGCFTAIIHTGQDIFVIPWNGKRIVDLSITAFLVFKEERWMTECCQLDKPKIVVSVKTPLRGYLAEIWQVASCSSSNNMNCSIHNAGIARLFIIHTLIQYVDFVHKKISISMEVIKSSPL